MINDFINKLKENNIFYDEDKLKKLDIYYSFLIEYNNHTNLTTITDKKEVYFKHFLDSLMVSKAVNLSNQTILDIGSGAGFPGIVLKIFYPDIKLTVLDSNNKKITFINMLLEKLNITDVITVCDRAENFMLNHFNEFDLCVSRAVSYVDIITSLSLPFIKVTGKVILMKGNYEGEYKLLKKYSKQLNVKTIEKFNYFLLESDRTLYILTKNNNSNKSVNYGTLKKNSENRQKKLNI